MIALKSGSFAAFLMVVGRISKQNYLVKIWRKTRDSVATYLSFWDKATKRLAAMPFVKRTLKSWSRQIDFWVTDIPGTVTLIIQHCVIPAGQASRKVGSRVSSSQLPGTDVTFTAPVLVGAVPFAAVPLTI